MVKFDLLIPYAGKEVGESGSREVGRSGRVEVAR
jgi:hypothetical protein